MNPSTTVAHSSSSSSSSSWFSGIVRGRSTKIPAAGTGGAAVSLPGDSSSSGHRKNQLPGVLFKYGPKSVQVAFRTGDFNQQVIFLGGLTDGLLATEYLEPLSVALENLNWSLVQPLLSSSYVGYGTSSLEQAPVSDREYRATLPETAEMIDLALSMMNEGRSMDLMPREANPDAPITAYRYHSLCAYMGDDDMFSSDLSEDQLRTKLGHMSNTPCQVIFSMADEYVPEYVDKKALVQRLCRAMGGAEKVEIEHGNHSLSNRVQEAVQAILDFVKREGPKGWDDPWH
ncbi:UPF0613 protein PB24D3.06c isoform X2 [Phalaenopsis equestris]|uniref:UPF0613 protein PB24D3.06c isoform X2 n=1 Tax=Phalaenopsis equestris TaxID=78828 RepID=UPI0009E3F2F8|nr:UPF0613 protein PB24D3.06c isoform X2 [Phalaenopsis equestris]